MKMIKLYIYSMYSNKIFYQSLITYLFMFVFYLVIGNVFTNMTTQIDQFESFKIDYLYQGILFLKLFTIVQIIIYIFQIHQMMDLISLKVIESNRSNVVINTIISLLILCVIHMSVLYLLYVINGVFLTSHFDISSGFELYLRLVLFTVLWSVILMFIYILFENVYLVLSMFLIYLFMVMFSGFLVFIEDLSLFIKIIHLYVSDLVLYQDLTYGFLYSDLLVLVQIGCVFFLLLWRFKRIDLK